MHLSYSDLATSLGVLYFLLPLLDPLTLAVAKAQPKWHRNMSRPPEKEGPVVRRKRVYGIFGASV
jgi:hypothetical protein